MRAQIKRAAAMGSPLARFVIAGSRAGLPPGTIEQHIETVVKMVKAVRSQAMDAGVKIAFEVHKDLQAWEFKTLVEAAGRDVVGIYLDTGNPVFVMEDPMQTVETLAPYAVTVHLRDSVVYEHPRGAAVQWVPLGEGVVDFKPIVAKVAEVCPNVAVYIKPITGRPPEILNYFEPEFWKLYPKARASDLARFMRLAKSGRPYERTMVIGDVPGGPRPAPEIEAALKFQQREHVERSVEYGKKVAWDWGKWRCKEGRHESPNVSRMFRRQVCCRCAALQARPLRGIFPIAQSPFTEADKLDVDTLVAELRFSTGPRARLCVAAARQRVVRP